MSNLYAYSDGDGFIHYNVCEAEAVFLAGHWLKRESELDLIYEKEPEIYSYWFAILLTTLTIGAFLNVFFK